MNSGKFHQNRIICSKVMTNQLISHKNAMKRHICKTASVVSSQSRGYTLPASSPGVLGRQRVWFLPISVLERVGF